MKQLTHIHPPSLISSPIRHPSPDPHPRPDQECIYQRVDTKAEQTFSVATLGMDLAQLRAGGILVQVLRMANVGTTYSMRSIPALGALGHWGMRWGIGALVMHWGIGHALGHWATHWAMHWPLAILP